MNLVQLQKEAYEHAVESGFHAPKREDNVTSFRHYLATYIALGISEFSEALEEIRKEVVDWPKFAEELADVVIRVADLAALAKVDLNSAVTQKLEKNKTRGYRHGRRML